MTSSPLSGKLIAASLALMLACGLSACVERVVERPAPQSVVYVQKAPPPEVVEVQPPPPGPPEIWVWQKGHWRWDGREYRWFPGRWVERPAHAHAWSPPHWEARGSDGFVFIEGSWR